MFLESDPKNTSLHENYIGKELTATTEILRPISGLSPNPMHFSPIYLKLPSFCLHRLRYRQDICLAEQQLKYLIKQTFGQFNVEGAN